MGRAQGPGFYDSRLRLVNLPLEVSPWRNLYRAAADLLPEPRAMAGAIYDLGCGTGRFAKLLDALGYDAFQYYGIDFSPARIKEAMRYVPEKRHAFHEVDLNNPLFRNSLRDHLIAVFVMLELLEHLEDDLGLLAALPRRAKVIFSVPNYDSEAHVRFFGSIHEVRERYKELLKLEKVVYVRVPDSDKLIYLLEAKRNGRS